jgi:hypothetical protein
MVTTKLPSIFRSQQDELLFLLVYLEEKPKLKFPEYRQGSQSLLQKMEQPIHDLPEMWTKQQLVAPPKGLPVRSACQSTGTNPMDICRSSTVLGLRREIMDMEKRLDRLDRLDQVNLDKNQAQICTEHFGKKNDVGDDYTTRCRLGILHKIQAKLTEYGGQFLFLSCARCERLRNHRPAPRGMWINLSISGKQGSAMSLHLAI